MIRFDLEADAAEVARMLDFSRYFERTIAVSQTVEPTPPCLFKRSKKKKNVRDFICFLVAVKKGERRTKSENSRPLQESRRIFKNLEGLDGVVVEIVFP